MSSLYQTVNQQDTLITREAILGARITGIYMECVHDGCLEYCHSYFTTDRGITFTFPHPAAEWHTLAIPATAHRIDHTCPHPISAIRAYQLDPDLGFYEPDSTYLLFSDGSRLEQISCSPRGTGQANLYHRPAREHQWKKRTTDFFKAPPETF